MRVGLLFSDVAAIVIGLFGLAALISFASFIYWEGALANGRIHLFIIIGVIMAGMTTVYLFPPAHQRILRSTFFLPVRIIFTLLSIFWIVVSAGYLRQLGGYETPTVQYLRENYAMTLWVIPVLFALLIFPVGLAYGDLRAEHRARKEARDLAARRARAAATFAAQNGQSPPERSLQRPPKTMRAQIVSGVLFLLAAFIAYSWFLGKTVQTATLDASIEQNALLICAAATLLLWAYSALNWRTMRERARMSGQGLPASLVGAAFGFPLLVVGLYFGVAASAFPFAWNLMTENPVATRYYVVTDVDRSRRMKGCLTLTLDPSGTQEASMCGLGREFGLSLRKGTMLSVQGELSAFGHTFEQVRVVR